MSLLPAEGLASALRRSGIGVHPLDWRLPPIDTYPAVVAFAQTMAGKALLFLGFAALLRVHTILWLELTVCAAAVSLAGRYRRYAALAAPAALLVRAPYWFHSYAVAMKTWRAQGRQGGKAGVRQVRSRC